MEHAITTKFIAEKIPKVEIWELVIWADSYLRKYFVVDYRGRIPSIKFFKTLRGLGGEMKGISNTSRTLEYIRSMGWLCDKVEIFNPYAGKFGQRKDMFGFADIVAMGENSIIAIQSFGSAFSEHHKKITQDELVAPNALKWLQCGGRIMLIGWRRILKTRKGKLRVWTPRIREYLLNEGGVFDYKDW